MTVTTAIHFLRKYKYFGLRKLYWIIIRTGIAIKERILDIEWVFPDYHQSLVRRWPSRKIIMNFSGDEGQNINTQQFFLGFGLLHYSFIRNTRPQNILCIGSRKGFVPAILALACKDNQYGHVDFVDAGFDETDVGKNWSGIGFWRKQDPNTHFGQIGVSTYITTHVMTTVTFARKRNHKKYEYIYIDGDHSYEGAKQDYTLFWPKLSKGGFFSFHDVMAHGDLDGGKFGVWRLWKELTAKHQQAIIFPFPAESGLGMIQKQ